MYHAASQNHGFLIQEMQDLLTTLQNGLVEQPVTDAASKKTLLDSIKQLDVLAKETAIDEQVEIRISTMLQEDIMQVHQNRDTISKLEIPISEHYPTIRAEEATKELPTYHAIKESIKKVNKIIKDGKARPVGDEEEEEVISEQAAFRMKDPISKKRIEDPVKNRICGHAYDRTSVMEYIKDNRKRHYICQCPQPGCKNKKALVEADIIDFPEFFELAILER